MQEENGVQNKSQKWRNKNENEMFKESVYTYESLSDSEKAIYNDMAGDN